MCTVSRAKNFLYSAALTNCPSLNYGSNLCLLSFKFEKTNFLFFLLDVWMVDVFVDRFMVMLNCLMAYGSSLIQ